MTRTIAKFTFYFVAIVLVLWTSTLTYSFVSLALPAASWFVPLFALVVFDMGMIAWLVVFIDYAAGNWQRAISIITCVFDLIGVGLMAFAEILLGGQTLTAAPPNMAEYAIWGIGIWTIGNVAAVVIFHLSDPEARKRMTLQAEQDAVFDEALKKLSNKRAEQSGILSDQLANAMMEKLKADLAVDHNGDGIPDILQSPNGAVVTAAEAPPLPKETKERDPRPLSEAQPPQKR